MIVCTDAEPLKKNHKLSRWVKTFSAYDTAKWAEEGLFLLLPLTEAFPGFSVIEGEMTQYSIGGKHVNRCNIKRLSSQVPDSPHLIIVFPSIHYNAVTKFLPGL